MPDTIPDIWAVMWPFLEALADGEAHAIGQLHGELGARLGLTQEQLEARLPSGAQTVWHSRVGWARTYLKKTGLIEYARRGHPRITGEGRTILSTKRGYVDRALLKSYPPFVAWLEQSRGASDTTESDLPGVILEESIPPRELLVKAHRVLQDALAQDLLERVLGASPAFFEELVVDLLLAMGYGGSRADAGRSIGKSGDEGVDGIINEDQLGLDVIYIQAKRWRDTVGRPAVQAFAGSLEGHRARKGVMITTSTFSQEARDYVQRIEKRIVLIDGVRVARLMIEHGVGVSVDGVFEVKRIDSDYFDAE